MFHSSEQVDSIYFYKLGLMTYGTFSVQNYCCVVCDVAGDLQLIVAGCGDCGVIGM